MKESEERMARYIESCRKEFWQKVFQLELEYLLERLDGCRDILSVGCGPAIIEGGLTERGFHVTGVDVSREALNCAPEKVRTIVAKAGAMSFPKASFEAVIFVASLQFIEDYRKALDQSALALLPNGRIIVMLLNPESTYFKVKSRSPDSYISKIKHTDLKAVEDAVNEHFDVRAEYYLSVEGSTVSASPAEADSVLYILFGTKRPSTHGEEETHA